jgi:hypothetical protein
VESSQALFTCAIKTVRWNKIAKFTTLMLAMSNFALNKQRFTAVYEIAPDRKIAPRNRTCKWSFNNIK